MSKDTDNRSVETTGAHGPDIDLVDAADWPRRDFPIDDGRRENSVRVVIKQSVLNDIHRHGQTTTDVEICGVLVGAGYRDERGPYIYVEANIRGQHSDSKAAQVTFTGETWNHIHNELDREFPDLQILGWYHTHPGFGIFLSGMDLFIHENYFSGEHQLALVYDPIGGDEGLFVWRGGKALRDGFLIEPDVEEDPPPVATTPQNEPLTAGAGMEHSPPENQPTSDVAPDFHNRLTRIENRQTLTDVGVFAALTLAIGVPLLMWVLWIEPQLHRVAPPTSVERSDRPATTPAPPESEHGHTNDASPVDATGNTDGSDATIDSTPPNAEPTSDTTSNDGDDLNAADTVEQGGGQPREGDESGTEGRSEPADVTPEVDATEENSSPE